MSVGSAKTDWPTELASNHRLHCGGIGGARASEKSGNNISNGKIMFTSREGMGDDDDDSDDSDHDDAD